MSRPTPETDALISVGLENADRECVPADFARKLERERDEAREKYNNLATENMLAVNKLCNERDEAREDQKNSRQSLAVAIEELDEAREALMKIEQLFIDGTDVYADREKMATIAIEALEVAK
jgi:hypothetical protein